MSDDRFDDLVDDVAKSMTSVPPDASLAQRVSSRIAEEGERRAARWLPWVLAPVASAFVVMLAVFVARESSVRLKPDATPVTNVATTPYVGRPFQGRQDFQRRVDRGPENLDRGPERAALQPLPRVEPIEVDRLEVAPLALSRIEINPI